MTFLDLAKNEQFLEEIALGFLQKGKAEESFVRIFMQTFYKQLETYDRLYNKVTLVEGSPPSSM